MVEMTHKNSIYLMMPVAALILVSLDLSRQPTRVLSSEPIEPVVVRLYFEDRERLNAVAGELDVWEVHHDAGYAVVAVTPSQIEWLESLGYRLEIDSERASVLGVQAVLDPHFYYYDDDLANANDRYVVDFLEDIANRFPDVTELIDIGDAWEAGHGGHLRQLLVLRISNEDAAYGSIAAKPAFFLMAGIHAREVATPELAIRYIQYLTDGYDGQGGYDQDPDVTWLVDYHVAYVLVMFNPDGHRVNEADISANWRKNLDNIGDCSVPSQVGVDLNRNHSFFWGGAGSSGLPCNETYHGPSAASEPEVQAFQQFFASVMPDQNGDNEDNELPGAAPDEANGIFITLHSYSDLVLWPWGTTDQPAPNGPQLQTIGRKFAFYNGYEPEQASELYFASGTTDDWTYGKLGGASFTFEVGPSGGSCGGFFPDYDCLDGTSGASRDFWAENRPALLYAHKIARTPYLTAAGPDAVGVAVAAPSVPKGVAVPVTALIDDTRYRNSNGSEPTQKVVGAEYTIDSPPGETGTVQTATSDAMTPADGAFDETNEEVSASVDTAALGVGRHTIYVRGRDADENWGAFSAVFLDVTAPAQPDALQVQVSPGSIPIGQGQATVTAAVLSKTLPVEGWPITFSAELGSVDPAVSWSDANGQAVTTFYAGASEGTARVTAQASAGLTSSATVELYVPEPPEAGFDSNGPVCLGTAVIFTDTSSSPSAPVTSWSWEFGDGATSPLKSPSHLYAAAGSYTVRLTAGNSGGDDTYSELVAVVPLAEARFTFSPTLPIGGQAVQFRDESEGEPFVWSWDFGDGSGSTVQDPTHVFNNPGTYTVALRAGNDCGESDPYAVTVVVGGDARALARTYLPSILRDRTY
jgi:PKD repeat protein